MAAADNASAPSNSNTYSSAFLASEENSVIDLRMQPSDHAEGGVRRTRVSTDSGGGSSSSSRTVSGAMLSEPPSTIPNVHVQGSRAEDAG